MILRLLWWLAVAWSVMAVTHECGHLIGGWWGGATLTDYDIAPWHLPYSIHRADPSPQLTLWAGPFLGVIIPQFVALVIRKSWGWFVADFCLLANGSYLALAWITGDHFLDTPRMLAAGVHPFTIVMFCVITIGWGYMRFRNDCQILLAPSRSQET